MKEVEKILRALSDGMKTLAKGVETIAQKVDALAKEQAAQELSEKSRVRQTTKKTTSKKVKAPSATDEVLQIIRRSQKGVNTAALKKKTGFNDKKIHNVIYRLKKRGQIRSIDKGVYKKV